MSDCKLYSQATSVINIEIVTTRIGYTGETETWAFAMGAPQCCTTTEIILQTSCSNFIISLAEVVIQSIVDGGSIYHGILYMHLHAPCMVQRQIQASRLLPAQMVHATHAHGTHSGAMECSMGSELWQNEHYRNYTIIVDRTHTTPDEKKVICPTITHHSITTS